MISFGNARIGEADLYRGLSARKNERLRNGRFCRKAAVGKQAKQNGGRYSAGLLTAPRPLRQASPSPTLQIHHILRWSMRMVPAMVFLFGHLSIM